VADQAPDADCPSWFRFLRRPLGARPPAEGRNDLYYLRADGTGRLAADPRSGCRDLPSLSGAHETAREACAFCGGYG